MNEIDSRETDEEYARLWRPDRAARTLFVTHLTPESATRYQFDVQDPESGTCVFSQGDGITPPRVVVELLNENEFTITNLPNVEDADPDVRANHIIDAIQWLSKHGGFEPGDLRRFAYQRAQNVLAVVYGSHLIMEVVGPDRYLDTLDGVLADASRHGQQITRDELLDPRTHTIEFLQTLLVEMRRALPMTDQERVADLAEERLGITVDGESTPSEATQTWDQTTAGLSSITLHPDATETLIDEGWVDPDELA